MSEFIIIPAIDLKEGLCVRLKQGRADDQTVYGDDPVQMAKRWEAEGAGYLHVVDLDGAFEGSPVHLDVVGQMVSSLGIPVQLGGGLRIVEQVEQALAAGISRAIIGTRAASDPGFISDLVLRFGGEHIAVGIDARDGFVQVKGWTETSEVKAVDLAQQMEALGVRTIIYTDTACDGMLEGVNGKALDEMCAAVSCNVIASGGVSSPADVIALKGLNRPNLMGAIVGKALYEDAASLADLQAI